MIVERVDLIQKYTKKSDAWMNDVQEYLAQLSKKGITCGNDEPATETGSTAIDPETETKTGEHLPEGEQKSAEGKEVLREDGVQGRGRKKG